MNKSWRFFALIFIALGLVVLLVTCFLGYNLELKPNGLEYFG